LSSGSRPQISKGERSSKQKGIKRAAGDIAQIRNRGIADVWCFFMARILAQVKVFPAEVPSDLKKIQDRIVSALPKTAAALKFREEPIAFGLVALIAYIAMPEESGIMDEIEATLKGIEGVSEIETVMVTRI